MGDPVTVSCRREGRRADSSADARVVHKNRASVLEAMAAEEGPQALQVYRLRKRRADIWAPAGVAIPQTGSCPSP